MVAQLLTDSDIEEFRELVTDALPDTAVVLRKTSVSDDAGGQVNTYVPSAPVGARVRTVSRLPKDIMLGEQLTAAALFTIVMPANTPVDAADRIQITASDTGAVLNYEVKVVVTAGSWSVETSVIVVKLD